eukprot:TRINITY_DN3556_c0_g1_i1.p2 TRINITY_DN3556_c0_g1~~TRINITY_DN3556_c0_g1_i1.p2  ORF type:complete len:221 (-),score=25.91 TRINITY_DN3556_c0_g1_i1:243-905(-)
MNARLVNCGSKLSTNIKFAPQIRAQKISRRTLQIVNLTSNDIKNGMNIEIDQQPWRVIEFLHVKPGKGSAFVRSKLKNCINGNIVDKTFRAGEPLQGAEVRKSDSQFTYVDGDDYVFMNMDNYEETRVRQDDSWSKYLKEGTNVVIVTWNDQVIGVEMPKSVELQVVETDPQIKGATVSSGSTKPAKLETGAQINVPMFIDTNEIIKVNTDSGEYLGRAN